MAFHCIYKMIGKMLASVLFFWAVQKSGATPYHPDQDTIARAAESLASIGVLGLCHPSSHEFEPFFPNCEDLHGGSNGPEPLLSKWRYLLEAGPKNEKKDLFFVRNSLFAATCVVLAALAAGLTLGLMSIDPLTLHIKMRAAATKEERDQAGALLPIVNQHHLLLVTLILLNSMANEALPIFLNALVPSYVAVIMSVTLVLFFGEIIPSAVFTGPNQMKLAFRLLPMVRVVMALFFPLAYPIAKLLDFVLQDEEEGDAYNRKELSALVRIQYEEHLASKRRHRAERAEAGKDFDRSNEKKSPHKSASDRPSHSDVTDSSARSGCQYSPSIHRDEVSMVEGALSMKTKVAIDVYTPLRHVFAVPHDTVLNEQNTVNIYSSGYSRIPVYNRNPDRERDQTAIRGILMTRQLIVVNASDKREVRTLPLRIPACVSPKKNLVDLINMFQTGSGGHMALVCARPNVATEALDREEAIPPSAGLMGIITLEDALESLLREDIYDEFDKVEREEKRLAKWVAAKWKLLVDKKKAIRQEDSLHQDQVEKLDCNEMRLARWVAAKWKWFVNKNKANRQEASLRHDPMIMRVRDQGTLESTPPSDVTPLLAVPHGSVDDEAD